MPKTKQKRKLSTSDAIAIATGKKTLDEVLAGAAPGEIDFSAAPPPVGQSPPHRNTVKPPRARKPDKRPAEPQSPQNAINSNYNIYNIDGNNKVVNIDDSDLIDTIMDIEAKLTLPEVKFLELILIHKMTVPKAIKEAMVLNTKGLSDRRLYEIGAIIRKKYEIQTEDKRNIFRDIGLGESQVAQNIKQLTESARSEMVRLNANVFAGKCLKLLEEPAQSHQGVKIIINCAPEVPASLPGAPGRPVQVLIQDKQTKPTKPLQITK